MQASANCKSRMITVGVEVTTLKHGIAANRATLETASRYSQEQGLTPRRTELEELYAASTMLQ
jgi:hypothetical protein